MDRKRNYFMNDGHFLFNPLEMFGFHGIYPKKMQQGFVDMRVNTHSVESDFSIFNCKGQDSNENFKNNFMKHCGIELQLGNSISKLPVLGGFIGSKCLLGANRSIPFLGKVLQQYNILSGNGQHLGIPTMKIKESTADYIKSSVMDAAVLISHSLEMICEEEKSIKKEGAIPEDLPSLHLHSNSCSEMQEHETANAASKQSYAEVAKSLAVSKHSNLVSEKNRINTRRMRSGYQTTSNIAQKEYNSAQISQVVQLSHKNRRNRGGQNKHRTHCMDTHRGNHKNEASSSTNIKQICVSTNSTKMSNDVSQNRKTNPVNSKQVHYLRNVRKLPQKRRANANFLNDIKEDCENMIFKSDSWQKNGLNYLKYNGSSSNTLNCCDSTSVVRRCMNWRCRPNIALCDICKMNSYFDSSPDHAQSSSQEMAVNFGTDEYKIESEVCVVTTDEKNTDFPIDLDSSMKGGSVAVAECSTVLRTRVSSECSVESEDSFIIMFDTSVNCSDDEEEEETLETTSNCSDSETGNDSETITSEDDSDEDDASSLSGQCSNLTYEDSCEIDECDLAHGFSDTETEIYDSGCVTDKVREANAIWESAYGDIPAEEKQSQKVQFAELKNLETVHLMLAWDFAYRTARCGPWEALARDHSRFQRRIEQMNEVLEPVLTEDHRRQMWQKIHSQTQEIT